MYKFYSDLATSCCVGDESMKLTDKEADKGRVQRSEG